MSERKNHRTDKQVREWVDGYLREHRFAPTVRELGAYLGIASSSTAQLALDGYKARGVLDFVPRQMRTIHVPRTTKEAQ